jgi:hypothetical protein
MLRACARHPLDPLKASLNLTGEATRIAENGNTGANRCKRRIYRPNGRRRYVEYAADRSAAATLTACRSAADLFTVSSNSYDGSESYTIPAPAWT